MPVRFAQLIFAILLLFETVAAQSDNLKYRLVGVVKDEMGAAIRGVSVTFFHKSRGDFQAITNEDGRYSIDVYAGTYSVTAEYKGHKGWGKYQIDALDVGDKSNLILDLTLKVDPNFSKVYGEPIEGTISDADAFAVKLIELDRLTKAIVDQKLVPIWTRVKCSDPSSLYVINYGSHAEVRRRRDLIIGSWRFKCDLTGFRITFVDGSNGQTRTVVWQIPAGGQPPKP